MQKIIPVLIVVACMSGCGRQPGENASVTNVTNVEPSGVETVAIDAPTELDIPLAKEPTETEPVVIAARFDRDNVKPGETVNLVVRCKIAKSWHIYSVDGPTGVSIPTKLSVLPPESVTAAAQWVLPTSKMKSSIAGPTALYTGDIRFSIQLAVAESAEAGEVTVPCEFHYQACTDVRCLPPTTKTLEIPLTIVSPKDE